MNVSRTVLIVTLVCLVGIGAAVLRITGSEKKSSDKTDEEIQQMFFCDRVTADVRKTDIYCDDPDLYRIHLKDNNVLDP